MVFLNVQLWKAALNISGDPLTTVTEDDGYYGIFPGRLQKSILRKEHLLQNYRKFLNQVEVYLQAGFSKLSLSKEHVIDRCFGDSNLGKGL